MGKIKLIIIDDEAINADGIAMLVKKSELPVEIVGVFYSSVEALAFLSLHHVDLIITDIKMPELSGLELVEKIRDKNHQAKVIIFTGYGTLKYAKEAMRFGTRHFLLKPVSPIELKNSILECIAELGVSRENLILKQKELIEEAILEDSTTKKVSVDEFTLVMFSDHLIKELHPQIDTILKKIKAVYSASSIKGSMTYYIFSPTNISQVFHQFLFSDFQAVVYIKTNQNLQTIYQSFRVGLESFECSYYYPKLVIIDEELVDMKLKEEKVTNTFEQLYQHMLEGEFYTVRREFIRLFDNCQEKRFSVDQLKRNFLKIANKLIQTFGLNENKDLVQEINFIMKTSYYLQLRDILDDLIEKIRQQIEGDRLGDNISANLNLIIQKHYSNSDLSLRWISKHILYLNPEYLGKVYLKETGKKFSSKLLEVRMHKAKELLQIGEKIHDVARLVGYENTPDYFGQLFKRNFGMTPKQYSKRAQ